MQKQLSTIILITLSLIPFSSFSINLDFDTNLFLGSNTNMQNNYDNLYFQENSNVLGGVIFRKGVETVTPTSIVFGSQTIAGCTERLQGAYYNPARGNRLRPLDPDTLNQWVLTEIALSLPVTYTQLGLTGGFYTNCLGNPDAVYGHIMHTRNTTTQFHLIAGVELDLANNTFANIADNTLQINTSTLSANGYIFDPIVGIGEIGVPPVCGNGSIEVGEQCDDGNTSNGDGCSNSCQIESGRSCIGQPSQCTQTQTPPPPINNQGSGTFNAWIQFPSLYTNTPFINGVVYVTEPAGYIIQGATQGTFAATLTNTANVDVILSSGAGLKTLNTTFTSLLSGIVITGTVQITLDLTNPTLTVTSPSSGSTQSGSVQFTRNAQDANGIQNTTLQIFQGNSLIYSTTTQNNTINISTLANGTYTAHITTYDNAGNSTTQIITFTISNSTTTSNRSIVPFTTVTGAELDTVYMSNPIIIAGLATGQTVTGSINTGGLVKNSLNAGTGSTFQNGDVVRVLVRSATTYNTTRTVNLSINNTIVPFSVTTKTSGGQSTPTVNYCLNENTYALIFLSIRQAYDDEAKFRQVLQLMLTMINGLINSGANQGGGQSLYALQCFADIVQNYINTNYTPNNPTEQIYTAPNGKKYRIVQTTTPPGYTSPDFQYSKIFVNYQSITAHIDANNPGTGVGSSTSNDHIVDVSFTPVTLTAPNGKQYTMKKTNKGFTSDQFTVRRYFETIAKAQAHINRHNPK